MFKLIICDLEGTLHDSRAVIDAYHQLYIGYISRKLSISAFEAEAFLTELRAAGRLLTGSEPGELAMLERLGLSVSEWLLHSRLNQKQIMGLHTNYALIAAFKNIPDVKLDVCTNTENQLAELTVAKLGLMPMTHRIWAPNANLKDLGGFPALGKPSASIYKKIIEFSNVTGDQTIVFGDRNHIDIQPADLLGIRAIEVTGPQQLIEYLESHLNEFREEN